MIVRSAGDPCSVGSKRCVAYMARHLQRAKHCALKMMTDPTLDEKKQAIISHECTSKIYTRLDVVSPNHWYTKLLCEYTLQILSLSFSHPAHNEQYSSQTSQITARSRHQTTAKSLLAACACSQNDPERHHQSPQMPSALDTSSQAPAPSKPRLVWLLDWRECAQAGRTSPVEADPRRRHHLVLCAW